MNQTHIHGSKEPDRNSSYCQFHQKEVFVGICPLCLTERLQTLASLRQSHYNKHRAQQHSSSTSSRGQSFSLSTKIFSLGSLLNRLELRSQKTSSDFSMYGECDSGSSSQQDSFISIKFEENGMTFWDKDKQSDKSPTMTEINTDIRPQGGTRRWRKRFGHIFESVKRRTVSKYEKQGSGS